jgi:3-(3-hydroxy-phenyl)propionate hydroxylase
VYGPLGPPDLRRLRQLSKLAPLRAVQVLAPGQNADAVEHVIDPAGLLAQACGVTAPSNFGAIPVSRRHRAGHKSLTKAHWALLRPDAYRAASGQGIDGTLVAAAQKALAMG